MLPPTESHVSRQVSLAPEPRPLSLEQALASATETERLEIGSGVLSRVPVVFQELFPGKTAVVIADENTWRAAGEATQRVLEAAGVATVAPFIFEAAGLYAEYSYVERLEQALAGHDAIPLAVGSGTLNDLTKLASYHRGRRYLSVATAASMDGYTAYGASITYRGSKQTFDCPAPLAVVADLDVISAAPAEMNAWGYADLMAKVTAGADWIVADALGVEPIGTHAWNMVQGSLATALGNPAGIRSGDPAALDKLVEGLMLGGFAMQATRSSRPASGAEHQFSHLWDMEHHTYLGLAPSHGLKVGVATLAVTAFYEALMALPLNQLDIEACVAAWPSREEWLHRAGGHFANSDLREVALREMAAKADEAGTVRQQLITLRTVWPQLVTRLRQHLLPFAELKDRLATAGAAVEPEAIGISRERLRASFLSAYFVRRRFTVLDLAVRAGVLDSCLDVVFGPEGTWPLSLS